MVPLKEQAKRNEKPTTEQPQKLKAATRIFFHYEMKIVRSWFHLYYYRSKKQVASNNLRQFSCSSKNMEQDHQISFASGCIRIYRVVTETNTVCLFSTSAHRDKMRPPKSTEGLVRCLMAEAAITTVKSTH